MLLRIAVGATSVCLRYAHPAVGAGSSHGTQIWNPVTLKASGCRIEFGMTLGIQHHLLMRSTNLDFFSFHSLSMMEYHAESRFSPRLTKCCRKRPSYSNPSRIAAALLFSLRLLHFH